MSADHLEQVEIASREALRDWLQHNHTQTASVWIVTWKKHMGTRHVPWPDVVDEALCFGWIDSVPRKLDADRSMVLLSPRKPQSAWSGINRAKIERLIEAGQMTPAGLAKVESARRDGSWNFLDDVERLEKPEDLTQALAAMPPALALFDSFPPSSRRGILEWIKQARTPQTRARRIAETTRLAAIGQRANQPASRKNARPDGRAS